MLEYSILLRADEQSFYSLLTYKKYSFLNRGAGFIPLKQMKNLKSTLYPLFILALLLGSIGIGLGLVRFTVSIEPESPDISSLPVIDPPSEPAIKQPEKPSAVLPAMSPSSPIPDAPPAKPPDPADVVARRGTLRVSNPTAYPVRLALLEQSSSGKSYEKPAHWDFAPMEGSSQGLMLSLPEEPLKLKKGDILMAFAQDGSRLYWGPYVVGKTPLPVWNPQNAEWQLVLHP